MQSGCVQKCTFMFVFELEVTVENVFQRNDCRHQCRHLPLCDLYHSITDTKFPNHFLINTYILRMITKSLCRVYFSRLHHPHITCNVLISIWKLFKCLLILLRYLLLCLRLSHDGISERMMRKLRLLQFLAERVEFLWICLLIHSEIVSLRTIYY